MQFNDARRAIRAAAIRAPAVVGHKPGGWVVYKATEPAPAGVEPELFCAALGVLPVPLTTIGAEVLRCAIAAGPL